MLRLAGQIEPVSEEQAALNRLKAPDGSARRLDIRLGETLERPSEAMRLLVGFHFGGAPSRIEDPAVVNLDLAPLEYDSLFEAWWYSGAVRATSKGNVKIVECEDYTVAILQYDEPNDDFQTVTRQAYKELLSAVRSTSHARIIKIWNYLGGINSGNDDDERYCQFSVGRADAFRELGIKDKEAPTGTAIGTLSKHGLSLVALASKQTFGLAENPRQVSAFHYPRQYGPSSPKFSRGGLIKSDNQNLFLISGTAAVVGHESAYPYDVNPQTDETLKNLDFLCAAVSKLDPRGPQLVLDDECILRVYLRCATDLPCVAGKLKAALGRINRSVAFLQGYVCRRELMVEIDGVKVVNNQEPCTNGG